MGPEGLLSKRTSHPGLWLTMRTLADVTFRAEYRIINAVDKFAFMVHTLGLKWEN